MKILFVDDHSSIQDKWIEPLRGEGWGVIRARSVQDAEKIFEFHGDSLDALIVSEESVEWAAKWNYPYIVFLKTWKDTQVMKHQNSSAHPAVAFIDYDSNLQLLKQAVEQAQGQAAGVAVKATGTAEASRVISFDHYEKEEKIEIVSTSLKPAAPAEVQEPAQEPAQEPEQEPVDQDRTVMIDPTTLANLEFSANPVQLTEAQPTAIEPEPEVDMELDLGEALSESIVPESEVPAASSLPTHGNKDLETMRNYLALREQDVAVLTGQLRTAQERVQNLEVQLKLEKARNSEFLHLNQKQEKKIQEFERDKQVEFEVLYQQVEDLNVQLRERTDKVRTIETKLKLATEDVDKVKERVRVDLRRIRVREKELESQLEILKKDSTALLVARDEKIVELKRKIDLLEFNMELVQEQYGKERSVTEQLRHKLKEAASAMKRAGGLLDHEN